MHVIIKIRVSRPQSRFKVDCKVIWPLARRAPDSTTAASGVEFTVVNLWTHKKVSPPNRSLSKNLALTWSNLVELRAMSSQISEQHP